MRLRENRNVRFDGLSIWRPYEKDKRLYADICLGILRNLPSPSTRVNIRKLETMGTTLLPASYFDLYSKPDSKTGLPSRVGSVPLKHMASGFRQVLSKNYLQTLKEVPVLGICALGRNNSILAMELDSPEVEEEILAVNGLLSEVGGHDLKSEPRVHISLARFSPEEGVPESVIEGMGDVIPQAVNLAPIKIDTFETRRYKK